MERKNRQIVNSVDDFLLESPGAFPILLGSASGHETRAPFLGRIDHLNTIRFHTLPRSLLALLRS
jgi:hypothetical protein